MKVDKLYKIFDTPLVFAGNGNCLHKLDDVISKNPVYLFWHQSWRISVKSILKLLKVNYKFKSHKSVFVICCNSNPEVRLCKLFGLNAHLLNQNMHECEFEFNPAKVDKKYDAIYIAQASPFKRMHLASKIKNLYILTYGCKNYVNDEGNDLAKFEPCISHANWNKSFINDRIEISKLISSSFCSLALSKREGVMWASVQYLFCGIPLVSTKSQGGRDFFYDDLYVKIVDDNADSVNRAVNYYKDNKIDPNKIRIRILEKIRSHRFEYINILFFYLGNKLKEDPISLYQKIWGSPTGIKFFLFEEEIF
jgi:glycosyltransferase involved in cell wall biosynthesis